MASSNQTGSKSAAELEREIEMQRGRVSDTIDQIQTKLSPGQIIDQLMGASGAQDFAQNMGRQVRDNPLPVALLGASLLWLMSGKTSNGASHTDGHGSADGLLHEPYYDDPAIGGNGMSGSHDGIIDKAKDMASAVGNAATGIGEKLSSVKDKVSQRAHDARDGMSAARHSVGGAMDTVASQARSLGGQMAGAQDSLSRLLRDQPLIAGALAFAAGAALGAALPVTSKETEMIGETASEAAEAMKHAAEPLVEQGKEMLDHAVEQGKEMLSDATTKLGEGYEDIKGDVESALGGDKTEANQKANDGLSDGKWITGAPNT